MTGIEYAIKEMEKEELFREDHKVIIDYCLNVRKEKERESARQVSNEH